jgi:hypothetical protein
MQQFCYENRLGYTEKGMCDISENYCLAKAKEFKTNPALDKYVPRYFDDNKDCFLPKSQQWLEDIFGTTVVSTFKTAFDPKQYEDCEQGWFDDGAYSCRKASCPNGKSWSPVTGMCYDRPCDSNEYDTGATCESCDDDTFVNNRASTCVKKCEEHYNFDGLLTCNSLKKSSYSKTKDNCSDSDYPIFWGGLCYEQCRDGKEFKNGGCYDKCASDEIDTGTQCEKCPNGYRSNGASMCRKNCPDGYVYDGSFGCNRFERSTTSIGRIPHISGKCFDDAPTKVSGLCYPECDTGFTRLPGTGTCRIPYHHITLDVNDIKPLEGTRTKGVGQIPRSILPTCDIDREESGGLCYTKCPAGFKRNTAEADPMHCVGPKGSRYYPETKTVKTRPKTNPTPANNMESRPKKRKDVSSNTMSYEDLKTQFCEWMADDKNPSADDINACKIVIEMNK